MADFRAVVFDLGGVILDLAGLRAFLDRHRLGIDEFFGRALGSGAHAAFERGAIDAAEYATAFLAESDLDLDPADFLTEFVAWPGGLLPGAADLLTELRAEAITTASLSNTNPLHWDAPFNVDTVIPLFDRHFPSYQFGLAKPDPELFRRVVDELALAPGQVVFFDDNQVNVDAAAAVGLHSQRVDGPAAARAVLVDLAVLTDSVTSASPHR